MNTFFGKIKNFFKRNAMHILMLMSAVWIAAVVDVVPVFAQTADVSDFVQDIGEEAELYNPDGDQVHRRALDVEGVSGIQTVIYQVLDVAKYALGSVAVLLMSILGVKLTVTGKSEEEISNAKRHFTYILAGFVIVMIADYFVANVLYGAEGEVLQSEDSAQFFARQGSLELQRIYKAIRFFVGSIAILFIIYHGFRMVMSAGEEIDEQKKAIQWAIVGLLIIWLAEQVVKNVFFANQGQTIGVQEGIDTIIVVTNFITGFVAFLSVAMVVYAGVQFVIAFVSEGSNEKGKKALIAAIIGILIVAASYAITTTMISFKP